MSKYDRDAIDIYILDHIDLTCSRMSIKNISKGMGLRKLLRIT